MKMSVILPNVEYTNIPFGHLHQLDQVGISNITILLNDEEFEKAHSSKFEVFDDTEPKTVIEHYQSQSDRFKIEVINTGAASTEEDKLNFYLKHAKGESGLNLFLCHESMPWVSEALSARPQDITTTECSAIPFFKSTERKQFPLFKSPCSQESAVKLLQDDLNPCLCYKLAKFDVLHYQWLFNIFVELSSLEMKWDEKKNAEFFPKFSKIIKQYNENITDLEQAEKAFEKTHKMAYGTLDEPDLITRWRHEKNVTIKDDIENNFPKLIGQLITLYSKMQENLNILNNTDMSSMEDDFAHKDFMDRIEGKPF